MGNSNDKLQEEKYENVMKKFKLKESVNHPQLGIVRVYTFKDNNNYNIFEYHKSTTSQQESKLLEAHYKNRKCYTHDHLAQIFYISSQHNQAFCQESTSLTVIGDYYYNNIYEEMKNTHQSKTYRDKSQFPEMRLWQIAYQIIEACDYLEKNGRYHGELKPKQIFLDENSNVKLIEHNLIHGNLSGYQKTLILNDIQFLSPELLKEIRAKNTQPNIDFVKADVFSLGVTLLELASLTPSESYYDWASKEVSVDRIIQSNDALLEKGYSTLLTNLIYQMVSEINVRPRFSDLKQVLSHFENEINNNIDFFSKYLKPKQQGLYHSVYTQPLQRPAQFNQTQSVYLPNAPH